MLERIADERPQRAKGANIIDSELSFVGANFELGPESADPGTPYNERSQVIDEWIQEWVQSRREHFVNDELPHPSLGEPDDLCCVADCGCWTLVNTCAG